MVPIVATDAFVFLRGDDLSGGDSGCFGLLEALRDSQENGLVSFLVGAAGGGSESRFSRAGGAAGGGGNLTGDILPDSPCIPLAELRGGSLGVSDVLGPSVNG
jgi:hypothetical protein